jgi:hypothetical protein
MLAQAQLSTKVSQNYPAHIVYKIDDLLEKIQFDEVTQIKIAQKFQKTDSLANVSLAKGLPVGEWKRQNNMDKNFLKELISKEDMERFDYLTNKDNRFLVALNEKVKLQLNTNQINRIRLLNDSIGKVSQKTTKEELQFHNSKLKRILTQKQFSELIQLCYQENAMEEAKDDWLKITTSKTNTSGKEKEEFSLLYEYHLKKLCFLDKKADVSEKTLSNFLNLKTTVMEPLMLTYARIKKGEKVSNNKYVNVIEFEKDLSLSKTQIDSLLHKHQNFEKIKIKNKENELTANNEPIVSLPIELEEINSILKEDQNNKWLIIKNKKEASKKASVNWNSLENEKLTNGLDRAKTIESLTIYHIKLMIAQEKLKSWKTRENLFALRDIEQKKPEALRQLESMLKSKNNDSPKIKPTLEW